MLYSAPFNVHYGYKYPTMDWSVGTLLKVSKCLNNNMTLILIDENVVDPAKQAIKIQIAVGTEGGND